MRYLGRDSFCLWGAAGSCGCSSEPSVRYRLCQACLNPLQSQNHRVTQPHVPCAQGSHHQGGLVLLLLQEHPCPRNLAQSSWCWAQAPGHLMNMSTTINALFGPKHSREAQLTPKGQFHGMGEACAGLGQVKRRIQTPWRCHCTCQATPAVPAEHRGGNEPLRNHPTLNNIYMGNQPWAPQTAWLALVQTLLLFNTK